MGHKRCGAMSDARAVLGETVRLRALLEGRSAACVEERAAQ